MGGKQGVRDRQDVSGSPTLASCMWLWWIWVAFVLCFSPPVTYHHHQPNFLFIIVFIRLLLFPYFQKALTEMPCEFLPHKVSHLKFSELSIIWGNVKINLTKTGMRKAGSPGHSEQRCDISIYRGTHLIISHLEACHNDGQKSPQKQKNWVKVESLLVNNLTGPWPKNQQ